MIHLLKTKFYFPPFHSNLVPRPRLVHQLNEGIQGRLTLISAPAGYGKSSLISEWHAGLGHDTPVAWLSLDESDNDPTHFWYYVISSLDTLVSGLVNNTLLMLESPQLPPIESLLAVLINELSDFPKDFVLALDDVHFITAPEIFRGIDFLLEHLPPNMHLVMLTRADPPLAISRLRANGQLTEIRARDLSFSQTEADTFLNDVMRLDLSNEQVNALETHTEGWIASLHLAALSMKGRKNVQDFLSSFTGTHHYLVDLFTEEVLQKQTDSIREFLLKTSLLERMTGSLCNALTGQTNGEEILNKLDRENLFLVPLDDERTWFRYHHLFAELLRNRTMKFYPDQMSDLHDLAARWYEQNSFISDAIHHALMAKKYEYAAQLIERHAEVLLQRGELITLLNLIDSIEFQVEARPWLAIYRAWSFTYIGQFEQVEPMLQTAEKAFQKQKTNDGDLLGNIVAIRAYNAALQRKVPQTIHYAQQALELIPEDNISVRSIVSFVLGGAYRLNNDTNRALEAWKTAGRGGQLAGNVYLAVSAISAQADILMDQGKLFLAEKTYREALQAGTRLDDRLLPVAARALAGLGSVYYEWNDLETASQFADQCIKLCQLWGNPDTLIAGYILLAQIWLAQREHDRASELISESEKLKNSHNLRPGTAIRVDTSRIDLWLAQGNLEQANHWVKEKGIIIDDQDSYPSLKESCKFAHILLARSNYENVLKFTDNILETFDPTEYLGQTIELLLIQALALEAKGESLQSQDILHRALSLGETEGYVRVFLDKGRAMNSMLQKAHLPGIKSKYVEKLLSMISKEPGDDSYVQQPIQDQLSQREVQVLELVAVGKSNQEIADGLVIALGTVKRHIYNIYNKLGVKSRTECVAQARELHLLQ